MKTLVMVGLAAIVAALVVSCTPRREDIPTYWGLTPKQAVLSAGLHARDAAGLVYVIAPTGSMLPKLQAGDYIVVDTHARYEDIRVGNMLVYKAHWLPPSAPTVCHWAAAKSGAVWIMDGQANQHYERGSLEMTEADFMAVDGTGSRIGGKVIAIYTTRSRP